MTSIAKSISNHPIEVSLLIGSLPNVFTERDGSELPARLKSLLLDGKRYPAAAFGALYQRRRRIEEAFKRQKHRLRLEAVYRA